MDVIPALASILGELRRTPGKNDGWIDAVWQTLERNQTEVYERARRRVGFARRLAHFAGLPEHEEAAVTVGLFLYQLLADQSQGEPPKPSRPWIDYLLANEEALIPAFVVAEAIQLAEWEDLTSTPAVIAKVAVAFDGALERRSRPLQVLQSLREGAKTASLERVTSLLWSEEGQELCDFHLRRRGQGYRVGPAEVRQSLETLRHEQAPAEAKPARSNYLRLLTPSREGHDAEVSEPYIDGAAAVASFENFEKRRQALRAGSTSQDGKPSADEPELPSRGRPVGVQRRASREEPADETPGTEVDEREPAADVRRAPVRARNAAEPPPPEQAADEEPSVVRVARAAPAPEPEEEQISEPREEAMVARATPRIAPNGADDQDLIGCLHEMRSWFDDMRRLVVDGQTMFNSLAPQLEEIAARISELEEFAARVTELEAMVERWKGLRGTTARAA